MAEKEILALYRDTPSAGISTAKAAISGDVYLLPRDCYTTTGVFKSNVANSGTNVGFVMDTVNTMSETTKLLSVRNNASEKMSVADDGAFVLPKFTITDDGTNSSLSATGTINLKAAGLTVFNAYNLLNIDLWSSLGAAGIAFTSNRTAGSANPAFQFTSANALTSGGPLVEYKNSVTVVCQVGRDGSFKAAQGLGLWNTTTNLTTQYSTTGTTTGFTQNGDVAADRVQLDSTFTGNSGSKAYTIGDIVLALKNQGIMAAS